MTSRFVMASLALLCVAHGGEPVQRAPDARSRGVERADIVVAQDGTGQYRTIQDALDAVPRDNAETKIILIRNGIYKEKIYVRSGHLAIVGEDRDKTIIEFAELRTNWRATHPDDWGAAVVNIGDEVTDLFLGNLTVRNNYGSLHDDHDHQFAIRSGGIATRISLVHARVAADGGDTLSLWNTGNGMYYHADCEFEGWVDYVCPRGWCYITSSRFFGHNLTASIWHDGSKHKDQKLVIRRSAFDGVPGFPLGRNNRDGQFFLLDNQFSANMADRPIYRPSPESSYQWPPRNYFANNRRAGGNFGWLADNLRDADPGLRPQDVTPVWTFQGQWDPESALPAALPFASTPRPETGDREASAAGNVLRWAGARNATRYRVAFGTMSPPPLRAEVVETRYDPGVMKPSTSYYWRVDAVTPSGPVEGPLWTFSTSAARPASGGASARRAAPPSASKAPAGGLLVYPSPWRVRLVLVGDSTVTDELGWGLGFKRRVQDRADCVNLARNGRSSKSYFDEGLWTKALQSRADYILIQFGHNDMPGKGPERETDPRTTYRTNLARYVDQARAAGAVPVLVTPLTRRIFDKDGQIASDLEEYVAGVKAVAVEKGVALVDLHARSVALLNAIGPTASLDYDAVRADGTADKTHLSAKASTEFGAAVADELVHVVPALAPYLK